LINKDTHNFFQKVPKAMVSIDDSKWKDRVLTAFDLWGADICLLRELRGRYSLKSIAGFPPTKAPKRPEPRELKAFLTMFSRFEVFSTLKSGNRAGNEHAKLSERLTS